MNFEKDLRELTDDELYKGINNLDPRYMSLFSDELTRRSTKKWSQRTFDLTILLFFVGSMQLFISLKGVSKSWTEYLFGIILFSYAIFYIMRLVKNKK